MTEIGDYIWLAVVLATIAVAGGWRPWRRAQRAPSVGGRAMNRDFRIGLGHGSIVEVNSEHIHFEDERGAPYTLTLPAVRAGYVADRKLDQAPWTVTFRDRAGTRFEFDDYESAYTELLIPLRQLGLRTFDLT